MSTKAIKVDTSKRTSKSVFSDIATNPKKKRAVAITLIVVASSAIWLPPIINYILTGSFVGLPEIDEEDVVYHIGYYTVNSVGWNSTRSYEKVNITADLLNYYTFDLIEANKKFINDGTVYFTDNVTILYVKEVESNEGLLYPNKTYIIYANMTESNPTANNFDFMPYPSSFNADMINLNGTWGTYDVFDIADSNFTMVLAVDNPSNGTLGQIDYIPPAYRQYENISNSGLWCKIDCYVYEVIMDGRDVTLYYDESDNTYFLMPQINYLESYTIDFRFDCSAIPTAIDFIQGQWKDAVLTSL